MTVENFAKGISGYTLLRVADNFSTRAKLCIPEEGGHFGYPLKKRSEPIDKTKSSYLYVRNVFKTIFPFIIKVSKLAQLIRHLVCLTYQLIITKYIIIENVMI